MRKLEKGLIVMAIAFIAFVSVGILASTYYSEPPKKVAEVEKPVAKKPKPKIEKPKAQKPKPKIKKVVKKKTEALKLEEIGHKQGGLSLLSATLRTNLEKPGRTACNLESWTKRGIYCTCRPATFGSILN